jgi:hypothetical protein
MPSLKTTSLIQSQIGLGDKELPELEPHIKQFVLNMAKAVEAEGCKIPRKGEIRHRLKTVSPEFRKLLAGQKTHDIRKNDRCFKTGDEILFEEWDFDGQHYTGNQVLCRVGHVTYAGEWGIPEGLCVMSIKIEQWALDNREAVTDV